MIYFLLIIFILFAGLDYFVAFNGIQAIEHEKNFYLDRIKVEGTLTEHSRKQLENTLEEMGFEDIEIITEKYNDENNEIDIEFNEDDCICRNITHPNKSLMKLTVKAKPRVKPFLPGTLLGFSSSSKGNEYHIERKGVVFSEKPKPND